VVLTWSQCLSRTRPSRSRRRVNLSESTDGGAQAGDRGSSSHGTEQECRVYRERALCRNQEHDADGGGLVLVRRFESWLRSPIPLPCRDRHLGPGADSLGMRGNRGRPTISAGCAGECGHPCRRVRKPTTDPRVSGLIARPHTRLQTNVPRPGRHSMTDTKQTSAIAGATAAPRSGRLPGAQDSGPSHTPCATVT
jgi:hypothetical protein